MINIQKYEDLGAMQISWLSAKYHFSFSNYYNPKRMNFGKLRVINDDIVRVGGGFATHHHDNMEIITYIRSGAITHKDSNGNLARIGVGEIQVMSAGTGIYHSEHNLENEDTKLYQIWIEPHSRGLKPQWQSAVFPTEVNEKGLPLLVSGRIEDKNLDILHINQYASIYGGRIKQGAKIDHKIKDQAYLLVSQGLIEIEGKILKKGDGCEITDQKNVEILAKEESELVIIDVPN